MPRFRVRLHVPALPLVVDERRGVYGAHVTRLVAAPDADAAEQRARTEAIRLLAARVPSDVSAEALPLETEVVERLLPLLGRLTRQPGIAFYPAGKADSGAAAI